MKKMTSKLLHKSNTLRGTIPINNSVVNYIFQQPTPSKTTASATTASATTASATTPSPTTPPIVLIGGTSQTIASLLGHHTPLANISGSGLLQYELRGQGKTTTLPLDDCSLARHVEDFDAVLDYHSDFTKDGKVDLCGFSFGGRVALAIAAERPHRIRKIVCTGVPADRGATGRLILKQWLRSLERGDLTNFIWQSISDGHSERFLNRHESRLKDWVASAVASNSAEAIHAIVGQTHTDDIEHPYHTINLAQKALENGLDQKDALFLVGDQDRIASPKQCEILANLGHWKFDVIQGAGHSVPIEQPRLWRDAVKGHLDVHPDGTRFATGGGDNHARIWAVAPVQDQRAQDDEANHPRLLAIATRHDAAVNVVRWSHDGVNLATGSDDTTIIIWRCLPGVSALGNVENWCSNTMLQGHTSDVKDLGWSPNDDLLATCSIDNTVRVWQMNENTLSQLRLNTPLVVLKGHTSWVRGLCWDPVGKYLASTSDDNTMIVWRTSDWKREVVVEEPFQGAPTVSTVRRLGWSPDGKTICASHAFKHPRHVASIVERTTWTSQLNLVGHETAVGAVRFNNRLFSKDKKGKKNASSSSTSSSKNKLRYRACCAIGSQDATLSVWMAGMPRALAIVHKLFDAEISDLSWNSGGSGGDGLCLFACSLDGSVCCLQFEIGDLGDISPVSKTKERLKALYGASAFATDTMLVESTAQLAMEDESSQSQSSLMNGTTTGISTRRRSTSSSGSNTAAAIPSNQPTMTSAEASLGLSVGAMRASSISSGMRFATSKGTNSPVRLKQRTTKGKGGRKRITPVLIVEKKVEGGNIVDGKARPPAPAKQLSSFPLSSLSSSSSSSSSSTSAAAKDSTNSMNDAIGLKGFIEIHDENSNGAITRVNKEDSEEEDATKKKKKKRIAVTNLTASTSTTSTTSSTSTATSANATSSTSASSSSSSSGILSSGNGSSKPSKKRVRISTPDDVVVHTKTNNDSNKKSNSRQISKRQRTSSSSSSSSTSSNRSTSNRNAVQGRQLRKPDRKHVYSIVLQNGHSTNNSNPSSASVSSSSSSSSSSLNSSNMTTTPTMLEYRIVPIRTSHGDKVTNDDTNERLDPIRTTVLNCTRGGDLLWRERVTGRAALLAGNGSFCAMATTAGEIYIFSEVGRRLSAPMVLPEPLAFLEVCTAPPSSNNTSTNAHNNNNNDNAASNTTSGTHNNDTTSNPETPTNPSHLLVGLTIHGTVYVWNVIERRIVMKSQECVRALLSSAEAELRAHVHLSHENGNDPAAKQVRADVTRVMLRLSDDSSRAPMIIVTVLADSSANNSKRRKGIGSLNAPVDASALRLCQSFVYDQHMESWNRVADHHFNRSDYTSGFANNLRSQTNSIHGGMRPLDALQATGHDVGSLTGAGAGSSSAALMSDLYEWGDTSQQWYETRAHLEHQIVASRTMVSPIEYSQWLSIYCKFLARDGRESSVQRLREVCNDLMGPPMKHVSKKVWDGVVMDLNKRELLRKKILPAIASNRGLQRIVSEYQDSLDQLEE